MCGGGISEKLNQFAKKEGIVIFGAGVWGKEFYKAMKHLPWKCFIDNYPKQGVYEELPIVFYKDFITNYQGELICILSKYHEEMQKQLSKDGIYAGQIINIGKNLQEFAARQYFDLEYLEHQQGMEIFVDAGSCDGMSSVYFKKWSRDNDIFVYVFEPDPTRRKICLETLEKNEISYHFIEKGLWRENAFLGFNQFGDKNNSGRIEESGNEVIEVTSLDNVLEGKKVTFIKMDIEGAEYQALLGAERLIRENRPKLAICVYHKPEDIIEIPELILKFYSGYKLYLRHYSVKKYETVLYALP